MKQVLTIVVVSLMLAGCVYSAPPGYYGPGYHYYYYP